MSEGIRFTGSTKTKTNVYCNYGSQEAGLVKHKLHTMNSTGIWYNKNTRYKIHIIQYTVHNIKKIKQYNMSAKTHS